MKFQLIINRLLINLQFKWLINDSYFCQDMKFSINDNKQKGLQKYDE